MIRAVKLDGLTGGAQIRRRRRLTEAVDVIGSGWTLADRVQALRVSKTLLSNGATIANGDSGIALTVVENLVSSTLSIGSLTEAVDIRGSGWALTEGV